jgi:hypothetical protein
MKGRGLNIGAQFDRPMKTDGLGKPLLPRKARLSPHYLVAVREHAQD